MKFDIFTRHIQLDYFFLTLNLNRICAECFLFRIWEWEKGRSESHATSSSPHRAFILIFKGLSVSGLNVYRCLDRILKPEPTFGCLPSVSKAACRVCTKINGSFSFEELCWWDEGGPCKMPEAPVSPLPLRNSMRVHGVRGRTGAVGIGRSASSSTAAEK